MHAYFKTCLYAHTIVNKSTQWLTNDVLAVLANELYPLVSLFIFCTTVDGKYFTKASKIEYLEFCYVS